MEINELIRKYLKSKGITITSVSEKTGIKLSKLSSMLLSKTRINVADYEKICTAIEVDPGYFFTQKILETRNKSA